MHPFTYHRAASIGEAVQAAAEHDGAQFLGGGTNLVDLMRKGVMQPAHVIDVTRLPLDQVADAPEGGLRVGALVRNSDLAEHPRIVEDYPALSEALLSGASAQLRNMATTAGNLMQRTRCHYFTDTAFPCNKREPGSGCAAIGGHNRMHAVLGTSEACVATHPSDMCVALAALGATVRVEGPQGERTIPLVDFHRVPGDTPQTETALEDGELITAVDLPPASALTRRSGYIKVRERASYAFALASVAAALDVQGGTIRAARLALGGVATKPWRAAEAEATLQGASVGDMDAYQRAADRALRTAEPLEHNAFKVPLAQRTIVRALEGLS